jgi:hypothetical protein
VRKILEDTEDGIDESGWERAMERIPRVSTEERARRYAERMAKYRATMKAQRGGR